jgi:ATP synthase F1 epsilon subunit
MAGNIQLEIVTPDKAVVSEEVKIVMAPGSLGEFGVLIGHTPFLTTLRTGIIRYTDAQGIERYVFVNGGFAETLPDKVTVWRIQLKEEKMSTWIGPKQPMNGLKNGLKKSAPKKISMPTVQNRPLNGRWCE